MLDKKMNISNQFSDFWRDKIDDISHSGGNKKLLHSMRLSAHKRAISNFVRILTGKNITVTYNNFNESYTDGKTVTISSDGIEAGNFDPAVGLALHEASHILLTDFYLFKTKMKSQMDSDPVKASRLKFLWNWIEDRRIDHWVYSEAPGYRGYYSALYDKYFFTSSISDVLTSNDFRDPADWNSYEFRVCNLINSSSDLDALPGLREINEMIDLKNISRLQNTEESWDLANNIYSLIEEFIEYEKIDEGIGFSSDVRDSEEETDSTESTTNDSVSEEKTDSTESVNTSENTSNSQSVSSTTSTKAKEILKIQEEFTNGELDKKTLSHDTIEEIKKIEESQAEYKEIRYDKRGRMYKENVLVIGKLTENIMNQEWFPFADTRFGNTPLSSTVRDGLRLGKRLASKLTAHDSTRTTTYTRQRKGVIDKRLLSQLGYNGESVFYSTSVEEYSDSHLHISIDGSSSMMGAAFSKAIKTSVAIAKAIDEVQNMECVISIRGTTRSWPSSPVVVIAYDSRVDNISKIRKIFPHLRAYGTTPEGLCFAAIEKLIPSGSHASNSYFVNMSDGEPYYENYCGVSARDHTRLEVKKLINRGVKVISYFISNDHYFDKFREMYGKNSYKINVNSITDIAKSLNKEFLSESNKN